MAFNECPGYPKEEWNRDGGSATRKWIGPWADRHTFTIPAQYESYGLYKDRVVIEPVGKGTVVDGASVYVEATIEAQYTPYSGGTTLAIEKGLNATWEFNLSYNVEHLTIPERKLLWGSDNTMVRKVIPKVMTGGEITLTKRNAASIPETAISACRGMVNSAIFLGYAIGTLLFMGATTRGVISSMGVEELSYTLKFGIHQYDWRYVWREDKNKGIWDFVYIQGKSPTQYIYDTCSFAGLIA